MISVERAQALRQAIGPYLENKWPFVGLVPNPSDHSTDNAILFSGTYAVLVWGADPSGHDGWSSVRAWFAKLELQLRVRLQGAVYDRYPMDSSSLNSHDNLIGLMSALYFYYPLRNIDIWMWGKKHWGSWNNQDPEKWTFRSCLARIPGVWAFVKAAASQRLSLFDQLVWSAVCVWNCLSKKEDTSGKCLQYLQNQVVSRKYKICDAAIQFWEEQMLIMYPGGMREVYAIYFGSDHPFAQYGPLDFSV